MKTKFKFLLFAAAATTAGFTSCSSDDDSNGGVEGANTRFSLTISTPKTYADPNATSDEVALNTVDVYIYKGTSFAGHASLTASDFTLTGDTWVLKETSAITTTTGEKTIYVGMNLPATIATAIENSGPSAARTITALSELKTTGFAMFSREAKKQTLTANLSENVVETTVSRLVSKVVFSSKETSYIVKGAGGLAEDLMFTAGNVNNKFFPLPMTDYKDPNFLVADESANFLHPSRPTQEVDDYVAINATGAVIKDANKVYAMENSVANAPKQGSVTYGLVSAVYTPAQSTYYATAGDNTSDLKNGTFAKGDDFWLVNGPDGNLFFSAEADAIAFVGLDPLADPDEDIVKYTAGKMYYAVWFKEDTPKGTASKYSIFRNTIYQVNVTDINGIGSNTDQPGDEDNPGVIDPEDPIEEEEEAKITVKVSIEDWAVVPVQNATLNGK